MEQHGRTQTRSSRVIWASTRSTRIGLVVHFGLDLQGSDNRILVLTSVTWENVTLRFNLRRILVVAAAAWALCCLGLAFW